METASPSERLIRYLYLDVVNFTSRAIEDQAHIVQGLSKIVSSVVTKILPDKWVIFIPVGDGICIAVCDQGIKYDDPIKLACELIRYINAVYNPGVDRAKQFIVRIGINQNIDNTILDINGKMNVCGSGVNYAQRIMNAADGNQILVGQSTWEFMKDRRDYRGKFRRYIANIKHGATIPVYQYIGSRIADLNRDEPSEFVARPEKALSITEAYYIGLAIKHNKFIDYMATKEPLEISTLVVLLSILARDAASAEQYSSKYGEPSTIMPITENNTPLEQYKIINDIPITFILELRDYVLEKTIEHQQYYEEPYYEPIIASQLGKDKLKSEHPDVISKLGLTDI